MGLGKCFNLAILATQGMYDDYLFKVTNKVKPEYFTRECKMNFKETMLFVMNMVKKSLQLELNDFFEKVLKKDYSVSKQAYSEARQKIEPKAFVEMNDRIIKVIYEECDEYERWNGYRLSAIDGSILELPNTELLKKEFSSLKNQYGEVVKAKVSCIFDVVNKIVIKSIIYKYDSCERQLAKMLLSELIKDGTKQDLILYDRGYPSAELISFHMENNINFVMRSSKTFSKAVRNAIKSDQIIKMYYEGKSYDVRVLRFMLDSGIEEILLTSLFDKTLTIGDFKNLYFKRWGIEVKFDELKNRLEIENFTGRTKIAIEQDFYASIYLSNMAELARQEGDSIIENRNSKKDLKHDYKTNLNILIGSLKDRLVLILLEKSSIKRNKMFRKIMKQVTKCTVPIRPGRHNERKNNKSVTKYKTNQKRCL